MSAHDSSQLDQSESFQQLKSEYERLQLLYRIARELESSHSLPQALEHVIEQTTAGTGAAQGSILLVGEHDERELYVYTSPAEAQLASDSDAQRLHQQLAEWVIAQRDEVLITDLAQDQRWGEPCACVSGIRSMILAPLLRGQRVRGVLSLAHPEPHIFDEADQRLASAIAGHVVMAIENSRLMIAVNNERRKFEGAVTNMDEGLLLVDGEGKLRFANPQALMLLNAEPPVPSTLEELAPPIAALLHQAQKMQENLRTEVTLAGPSQLDLAVHIGYMPMLAESGDWWTIVLHDITPLKEYDRLKTRFVSNTSHELRTPLANIKIYVTLAQHARPEQRDGYLDTVASEVSRLQELIEDLLMLSRIDSRQLSNVPTAIAVPPLVEQIVKTYQPLAEAQGLTLKPRAVRAVPPVYVDEDHLSRIIINLLSNALKFTPAGGTVTIVTEQVKRDDRRWVAIRVIDTGIGIAEEDLPQLFKRFYRSRDAQVGGTGLGLAIVHEMLMLCGGEITVESKVGQGSIFTCWLPPARPAGDDPGLQAATWRSEEPLYDTHSHR